jgi:hypothetical protein
MASKMPMEFSVFEQSCKDHGYTTRIINKISYYVMFTNNSIKTEIKTNNYTIGYGRTFEELDILEDEMKSRGFPIKSRSGKVININYVKGINILDRFWEIVAIEENIDSIVAKARGIATKVFSREVADKGIFRKVAKRYFNAFENEDQDLLDIARTLLSGDSIDHIITLGESVAHTEEDSYREHIVPCILIHNKAIEMVKSGASIVEVASMIKSNLGIVLISNKEQKILDEEKGWRTIMPDGWIFGNDPLARLKQAGIKLR